MLQPWQLQKCRLFFFRTLKSQIEAMKSKLVVLSNRLPFVLVRREDTGELKRVPSAGGLVTAVAPVVVETQGYWLGWPGKLFSKNDLIPEPDQEDKTSDAALKSNLLVPILIENDLFFAFYNGCCNGTFWPLLHSMPDRATFQADHWAAYKRVNRIFGEQAIKTVRNIIDSHPDKKYTPIVWVHDYHLMVAPTTIKELGEKLNYKLSFFLHTPFPSWDVFRLFPWGDEVLQGLLACDMIGFHTQDYCLNFIECCERNLGCRVDREAFLVEHGGQTVSVRALPVGIPYNHFTEMAKNAPSLIKTTEEIILGVDRLDYTKGLTHRLKAMEILLQKYPEFLGKVTLLQIAVPTREDVKEYQELKEEMDMLVGRINGKFATANWSPIRYIYGTMSQDKLAGFYRDSRVAFVTPLRDGMNLVAMEYTACQIKSPPGVLVLSPFTGAATLLHEALHCNIYELDEAADVLKRALLMPEEERIIRMNLLKRTVKRNDVDNWIMSFLKSIGTLMLEDEEKLPAVMGPIRLKDFDKILSGTIKEHHKLALLLDYDGTLTPLEAHPDLAKLPDRTRDILQKLTNLPSVTVSVISGRSLDNLKSLIRIKNINYVGSHGMSMEFADGSTYNYPMPEEFKKKAEMLLIELNQSVVRDGAWVEPKGVFLTWHYRNTPKHLRADMYHRTKKIIEEAGFVVSPAHEALEAKPPIDWHKGRASFHILKTFYGLNWDESVRVIYVGDDVTDEDAIKALKGIAVSFRVSESSYTLTAADHRLPDVNAVFVLLEWILNRFSGSK